MQAGHGNTTCNTTCTTQEAEAGGSQVQSLLSQKQERRRRETESQVTGCGPDSATCGVNRIVLVD